MSDELKKKIAENLKPALVRAVRTFIEVGIASIGGAVVFEEVNWLFVLSASGLAALISFLASRLTLLKIPKKRKANRFEFTGKRLADLRAFFFWFII